MKRSFFSILTVLIFLSFGCGSGGGSDKTKTPAMPAKVIVDGLVDLDYNSFGDFSFYSFNGSLKNVGGEPALNPRIHLYAGKENIIIEDSLCHVTGKLDSGESAYFSVLAGNERSYNSYEIKYDNYYESIENQIIPRLFSGSVRAELGQSTGNPVYDIVRFYISFKDELDCGLYYEGVPVSGEISISYLGEDTFMSSFGPITDSDTLSNFFLVTNRPKDLNIMLADIGLNQYEIEEAKISVRIITPNQGTFYYEIEDVRKCSFFC